MYCNDIKLLKIINKALQEFTVNFKLYCATLLWWKKESRKIKCKYLKKSQIEIWELHKIIA